MNKGKLETHYLLICAALAAGEALGFATFEYASVWPSCAVVAVGAAVFGHGLLFRFWYLPALFLLGLTLAFAQMDTRCRVLREGAAETHRATFHHALTIESEPIFGKSSPPGSGAMTRRAILE